MAKLKFKKGDESWCSPARTSASAARSRASSPSATRSSSTAINVVKRHTKPTRATMQGGIIDKEMPIHVSNVALWCKDCGATRVGYRFDDDGKKHRDLPQVRK